jgi:hypothetical protein
MKAEIPTAAARRMRRDRKDGNRGGILPTSLLAMARRTSK